MTIAIDLNAHQQQALTETAQRLQVSEAELAAAAVRDLVAQRGQISILQQSGCSRKTPICIAVWLDALAELGRGAGAASQAD